MQRKALWGAACAAALMGTTAWGQTAADIEHLQLDPSGRGSLTVGNGQTLKLGEYTVSATLQYGLNPLSSEQSADDVRHLMTDRFTAHLAGAIGVSDWLHVAVQVPIIAYQINSPRLSGVAVNGLGTPFVSGRASVLQAGKESPVDLAVELGVGLPLGSEAALGNGGTAIAAKVLVGRQFEGYQLGAELGALIRPDANLQSLTGSANDRLGNQLQLAAMVATNGNGPRGEFAVRATTPLDRVRPGLEALLGLRVPVGDFEVYGAAGPGMWGTPDTPSLRVYIGAAYGNARSAKALCLEGVPYKAEACPDLDQDGDGTPNGTDKCPTTAGPKENAGCPDTDADKDGVVDRLDKCPQQAGLKENAGCPDTDKDNDGTVDRLDKCPDKAGPKENEGCPDTDKDKDGTVDRLDKCPDQAGPKENGGCPDTDADKDGVVDRLDKCPDVAGVAEEQGCPAKDTDGDGVPDNIDNCKTVPGPKENKGCPAAQKQLVNITSEKLEILDKVYFASGQAVILAQSYPLLDQVARILKEHTEIPKVRIEGHTDNTGPADYNRALSQSRAEAVRDYLVKKGVDTKKLEPRGFGPDKPAASNDTPQGRDQNRRVDFNILQPEQK